jgi:hypothetical protein
LLRRASVVAAKKRVPARDTATIASPAMCSAFTHSRWVSPLSPAPSARLAARTRRTPAAVSSRERAAATRVTVSLGGAVSAFPGSESVAEGIGRVAGRGTSRGAVSTRSGSAGLRLPDARGLRRTPGGRREADTAPWCRTILCGRGVATMDASGTMAG